MLALGFMFMKDCLCSGSKKRDADAARAADAAERAKKKETEELANELAEQTRRAEKDAYEAKLASKAAAISIEPYAFVNDDGAFIRFTVVNNYETDQDGLGVRCDFFRGTDGLQIDQKTFSLSQRFPKGKKVKTKTQPTGVWREYKSVSCSLLFAYDATP